MGRTRGSRSCGARIDYLAASAPLPVAGVLPRPDPVVAGAVGELSPGAGPRHAVGDPGSRDRVHEGRLPAICIHTRVQVRYIADYGSRVAGTRERSNPRERLRRRAMATSGGRPTACELPAHS
jgi:hypothetical protein